MEFHLEIPVKFGRITFIGLDSTMHGKAVLTPTCNACVSRFNLGVDRGGIVGAPSPHNSTSSSFPSASRASRAGDGD
jgi:hypothetical protein